jgi:hypothetical protein
VIKSIPLMTLEAMLTNSRALVSANQPITSAIAAKTKNAAPAIATLAHVFN